MELKPRIGVVTVTYNSGTVLLPFLKCVLQQTQNDFILFVVDNASSDNTLQILRDCGDERLRIIGNLDNRGVAEANNQGIRAALKAGCSSVLLLNNDTEFNTALFSILDEGLRKHDAEMICPKMMYFDEPKRIWAAGGKFQPWLGYKIVHLGADQIDVGQHNKAHPVLYVPTCCVLIKMEVFEKVGLMDERYFVYVDDVDFMYRAMKAGIKLIYTPETTLLHKVSSLTGGDGSPFALRYQVRNWAYFQRKHLPRWLALLWYGQTQARSFFAYLFGKNTRSKWILRRTAAKDGWGMR